MMQSFAICNKIKEIDEFLERRSEYKNKVIESHPKVCFSKLNFNGVYDEPSYEYKSTEEMKKRLALLSKYYDKTQELEKLIHYGAPFYKVKDDVVDALCLAVMGMIGRENEFITIPEKPMKDSRGIVMQMVLARLEQ